MTEKKPLTVDFTQKDAALQFNPHRPLLTSYGAGWENVGLEHHRHGAWETPEHCIRQCVVVVQLKTAPGAERKLDNRHKLENTALGEVAVIPPNIPHWSVDRQDAEYLFLVLNPKFVSQVSPELVDPDCVELVPHFAQPDPLIYGIGLALKRELEFGGVGSHLYVESAAMMLAVHLLKNYSTFKPTIREYEDGLPKDKLRQAIAYVSEHLAEDLSLEAIAQAVGMSQYYFCRLFKQSMGITPHQYRLRQRIERAKQLLSQRRMTIAEIASQVGFTDQSHFINVFRKRTGMTPKAYQRKAGF